MNCEQFIDGIYDEESKALLLREKLEGFIRAVARPQSLELANKTARARRGDCQNKFENCMV